MKKTDQSGHSMISHTTRQTALCKLYLIALFLWQIPQTGTFPLYQLYYLCMWAVKIQTEAHIMFSNISWLLQ